MGRGEEFSTCSLTLPSLRDQEVSHLESEKGAIFLFFSSSLLLLRCILGSWLSKCPSLIGKSAKGFIRDGWGQKMGKTDGHVERSEGEMGLKKNGGREGRGISVEWEKRSWICNSSGYLHSPLSSSSSSSSSALLALRRALLPWNKNGGEREEGREGGHGVMK